MRRPGTPLALLRLGKVFEGGGGGGGVGGVGGGGGGVFGGGICSGGDICSGVHGVGSEGFSLRFFFLLEMHFLNIEKS